MAKTQTRRFKVRNRSYPFTLEAESLTATQRDKKKKALKKRGLNVRSVKRGKKYDLYAL